MRTNQKGHRRLVPLLLSLFIAVNGFAQCCPLDSLKLNSGYNPMTGATITPTVRDPKWIITFIGDSMRSNILASGRTAACPVGGTGAAFVAGHIPAWHSSSASEWINCFDSTFYINRHRTVGEFWTTSRSFSLCDTACVHFRLGVACDNRLILMSVSDVAGDPSAAAHSFYATYNSLYPVNFDTCLSAGTHYLNFSIIEDSLQANYSGIDVEGYITTRLNVITPENCTGLHTCTKPVINHPGAHFCLATTDTLTANVTGVSWTSSNTTVAVISSAGIVTTLSLGSTLITFRDSCGRTDTTTITVMTNPVTVTGPTSVCSGSTITLTGHPSSGTWSSSSTATAAVGATTGVVTGALAGAATITYTLTGTGCYGTLGVTVLPLPFAGPISGADTVCTGATITFSDTVFGGTWSSSATAIAIVGPISFTAGVVTGVAAGAATITYSVSNSCGTAYATKGVTVLALPADSISIPPIECVGDFNVLYFSPPGGTWSSTNPAVASVDAWGDERALAIGTTTIAYSSTNRCGTSSAVQLVTVIAPPVVGLITGTDTLCVGTTSTLVDTPSGGTWSSSAASVASVNSTTGVVTGVSSGSAYITYTVINSCGTAYQTVLVTINNVPALPTITGRAVICAGNLDTLTPSASGGTWTSSNTAVAVVNAAGIVTGVAAGTATISYGLTNTCGTRWATFNLTVNAAPSVGPITGPVTVCAGDIITLADATSGGTWSSSNTAIATVSTTGTVTGVAVGSVTISYTVTNSCGTTTRTKNVTVNSAPSPITSKSTFCVGETITFTDATTGGTWSSSNTAVMTINPTTGGAVAVSVGSATITYATSSTCYVTLAITVATAPTVSPIIPPAGPYCTGNVYAFTDATPGGIWLSTNPTVGTIDGTGHLAALSAGTTTISYSVTNQCGTTSVYYVLTIRNAPGCVCDYTAMYSMSGVTFYEVGTGAGGTFTSSEISLMNSGAAYDCYINHNVTIPPGTTVTMTKCVVIMAPNVSITVQSGAKLVLNGSHLFCCPGKMWTGIIVQPTGQFEVTGNNETSSLIEDAKTGVDYQNPVALSGYAPSSGTASTLLNLKLGSAIFNKNTTAINVNNFVNSSITPLADNQPTPCYPFLISNTAITSRDFSHYTVPLNPLPYPFVWPNTHGGTGSLCDIYTPSSSYKTPYSMDNPAYAYTPIACNNGLPAIMGIALTNIGATTTATLPGTETYYSFFTGLAGSANSDVVVFDNLINGIKASGSNLCTRNCVFEYMKNTGAVASGVGVYSSSAATSKFRLKVYGAQGSPNSSNSFYDCYTGVTGKGLYNMNLTYARMYSTKTITGTDSNGRWGFNLQSPYYYDVQVNHNTFYNIKTAVNYTTTAPASGGTGMEGYISICSDTVSPTIPSGSSYPTPTTQYDYMGISVTNYGLSTSPYTWADTARPSEVNIDSNFMRNVYNGIYVVGRNWENQIITADYNNITMIKDVRAVAVATPYHQAGIGFNNAPNHYIMYNTVTGVGTLPSPPSSSSSPYLSGTQMLEGINSSQGYGRVTCNTVSNLNTCFYLANSAQEDWYHNTMSSANYGMALNGSIGIQPPGYLTLTTDNQWTGSGWSGINYNTYTVGTTAASGSDMYVNSAGGAVEVPSINSGDAIGCAVNYCMGITIHTNTHPHITCVTAPHSVAHRDADSTALDISPLIAAGSQKMFDPTDPDYDAKTWIAQDLLYNMLQSDTTIIDTSMVLKNFYAAAQSSRFEMLRQLDNAAMSGGLLTVDTMLAYPIDSFVNGYTDSTGVALADVPSGGADNAVDNYRQYYQLLSGYLRDTLSSPDSANLVTLANKCPLVDGPAVYRARSLYVLVFDDYPIFSDAGCGGQLPPSPKATPHNGLVTTVRQKYTLYPNPTDGHITLQQTIVDNATENIEIWDAMGRTVYKQSLGFSGGKAHLQLSNAAPGLYLVQVIDTIGERFVMKFTVE